MLSSNSKSTSTTCIIILMPLQRLTLFVDNKHQVINELKEIIQIMYAHKDRLSPIQVQMALLSGLPI